MRIGGGIFQGLEVFVELEDGTRLNEYPGPVDTAFSLIGGRDVQRTMCCYLECPADRSKSFKIRFGGFPLGASSAYSSGIHIDGQKIKGCICSPYQLPGTVSDVYQATAGTGYEFPLRFKRLETTDDATTALSPALSKSAGRIEVAFQTGSLDGPSQMATRHSATLDQKPIHEKAKKAALDSSVQLGENKRAAITWHMVQPFTYPRPNELDLVVIFLYRGRELLMAQDIIERPARNPVDDHGGRSTAGSVGPATRHRVKQEVLELRGRLGELEGGMEAGGSAKAGIRRKRRQESSAPDKRPRRSGANYAVDARQPEVVDLTFDSD